MAFSPTTPVTGTAQTGFTSPTYTLATDVAPTPNGKQWQVSAIGGTQPGVAPHSIGAPFTITAYKPYVFSLLSLLTSTGLLKSKPGRNVWKVIVRKGVLPLAGQANDVAIFTGTFDVPAGADTADGNGLRAAMSAYIGTLSQVSAAWGDSMCNGSL